MINFISKTLINIKLAFQYRWKIFFLSLVIQFIMASLIHFGTQVPEALEFLYLPKIQAQVSSEVTKISSPQQPSVMETIKPKLEQKPNTFQLKNTQSWISSAYAAGEYDQASSYVVIDYNTGEVLTKKNADTPVYIASLTKIMTAIVAMDLASLEDRFTVSQRAASIIPTKIGVVAGQQLNLNELLHASMMTSANDAVQVINEGIDNQYQQEVFVKAMNAKAQVLGLKNTHFENPQGFDSQAQYSSAADLAILSHYALENYPEIKNILSKQYEFLPADSFHKQFDLYNWNGLLGVYPGVEGLKIGNTEEAGYTTVVVSTRRSENQKTGISEDKNILIVLLGAPGVLERDLWASQLLDLGFEKLGLPAVNITPERLQQKYSTWKYWG